MSQLPPETANRKIERWIAELDSLVDGERSAAELTALGIRAIPYLERFLLDGRPRTIALPRCRAVRALGELGACSTLAAYFRRYEPPADAAVLFAEDAVRSAAARELLRWKSDETFEVLLNAAKQRATDGLIFGLGQFHNPRCIPLFFELLEDDLCREVAKEGLRKMPEATHPYAILLVRKLTDIPLYGPSALRRRRATLQLLQEFGVSSEEWRDLRGFLLEQDPDVVIAAVSIGLSISQYAQEETMLRTLFRVSCHPNWVQEDQIAELLDAHRTSAKCVARVIVEEHKARGEHPNWLSPLWRILKHVLGEELETSYYGAA